MCGPERTSQPKPMWEIESIVPDPTTTKLEVSSYILSASIPIDAMLETQTAKLLEDKVWKVGLADFFWRRFRESKERQCHDDTFEIRLQGLEEALFATKRRKAKKRQFHPYILERSDFYCCNKKHKLCITIRVVVLQSAPESPIPTISQIQTLCQPILDRILDVGDSTLRNQLLKHLASLALQQAVRSKIAQLQAIAFCGNGSILPRKSGTSDAPMASPPAVPFLAPPNSTMTTHNLSISISSCLADHLPAYSGAIVDTTPPHQDEESSTASTTTIVLSGLLVPKGITLICGGGYHGKSTLLQAIAVGQYDKIPGDGRELCVSLSDAVTVRAEDGRYVNNCNISAFISNLPTPPGVTKTLDTEHFSTRDSSGSTSQASNVSEAIELGAKALLVDEDISAANFMARDGRMRALVMDESITPLLYRVNGLYNKHGISTVVVVGGVGDWLDVPHQVILLDKYVVSDATEKAQSISRQFSYGHVQYAGRGVVHRLEWNKGTPKPRRPNDSFSKGFDSDVVVSLLDGGKGLFVYREGVDDDEDHLEDDEEEGCIDASRLGQLLGKNQLFAAGLCAAWILQNAPKNPQAGLKKLLELLDSLLDQGGMSCVLAQLKESKNNNNDCMDCDDNSSSPFSKSMIQVLESVGYLERPRSFEVGQALTRMRGIRFDELPVDDDGGEEAARLEEEKRKKALAELWAKRRSKKKFGSS